MKKLLICIVVALVGFTYVSAQNDGFTDNEIDNILSLNINEVDEIVYKDSNNNVTNLVADNIRFGVIGGYINSTIGGTDAESFDCSSGFLFGGIVLLPISGVFAVQAELLYATMGSGYGEAGYVEGRTSSNRSSGDITGTYKLNYLLLPISAKYYLIDGLSLEAGPQVGFLLSANDEWEIDGVSGEMDVKDQTKGIDFGFNAGAGYEFDLGIYVRARYYFGLTELNDLDFPGNESWKNSALQASIGFFFN